MVKDLLVHERSCPERTVECPDPDNNCGSIVEFVLFLLFTDPMLTFSKLCLKSISSHSKSFWTHLFLGENGGGTPTLSHFQALSPEFC